MRSTKIMLLGLALMIVALYIPEVVSKTGGNEIYIIGVGLIVVIIGFFKKDKKDIL